MTTNKSNNEFNIAFLVPLFTMVVLICLIIVGNTNLLDNGDYYFLYNRAKQMLQCIQDGNSFDFYYNDFNGVGYGSTFFYGNLTLIPFLPLLNIGSNVFLSAYIFVAGIIFCLGSMYLVSRFTENYAFITTLYLLSTFVVEMFLMTGLIVNYLAVGLSFLFIGCCIDFFRNKHTFIYASFLFFLILNTHIITALLSFIICCFVCLFYFNRKRILDYLLFFITTVLFCSYFIVNFCIHYDSEMNFSKTTKLFLDEKGFIATGSKFIIQDFIGIKFFDINTVSGYSIFGVLMLLVSLICLVLRHKTLSMRELFTLILFFVGVFVGLEIVWTRIIDTVYMPIQFPIRYMFYLLLAFYIICFRKINKTWLYIFLIVLTLPNLAFSFYVKVEENPANLQILYANQLGNYEYLYRDFDYDIETFEQVRNKVTDENGNLYTFVKDKNILYIKYDTNEAHKLTIPKLYYKGYICENESGNSIKLDRGKSQFITLDVPINNKGILTVYHKNDTIYVLKIISYLSVFVLVGCAILNTAIKRKNNLVNY